MSDFSSIRTFGGRKRGARSGLQDLLQHSRGSHLFFPGDDFVPPPSPAVRDYAPGQSLLPVLRNNALPQVVLDIGCGSGESLLELAKLLPQTACYGIEVDKASLGKAVRKMAKGSYPNVRIFGADALQVSWFADKSVDAIHLFFPDPWPKKRHHKRRIIHPQRVERLLRPLKPGGYLALCTDWEEYAWWMREVLTARPQLSNRYTGFAPRPAWRPITYYEHRAQQEGRMIRDLLFDYA